MADEVKFRIRARLLEQIGEQLIKSESIALMELIKNAYDADASHCLVEMYDIESFEKGYIVVTDDGSGMNYNILKDVWLDIGTSNKADKKKVERKKRSHKYHRIPLGEKGIGRFGVHRLGCEIEVITRMGGDKECRLFVNWDNIGQSKYIDDFPIILEERVKAEIFKDHSGTKITIRRLKTQWDRATVRECSRAITSLNSPFDEIANFRPEFIVHDSDWLVDLLKFDEIETYKLYSFEAKMNGSNIINFKYSFLPYQTMTGIKERFVNISALPEVSRRLVKTGEKKEVITVDLSKEKIGTVIFKGIIFDLDTKILKISMLNDVKGFKNYLAINGGIRVFRDKLRIWDYGEPENDWLEMETRRINQPTMKISKRQILGTVYLNGDESTDLKETADREGFLNNNAYQLLKDACRSVLKTVEDCRGEDKVKLRTLYGQTEKKAPVVSSLAEAKLMIAEHIKDVNTVNEINHCLDRIQNDYDRITNNLITSAGAGLNLIVVIHQMQKILKNIRIGLEKNISIDKIKEYVNNLSNLVEGYSILVKKSTIKTRNLKKIIETALFNVEFRLEAHNISLDAAFRNRYDHLNGLCTESHVMNALMNLIDNSIWWIDFSGKNQKSIFIDISSELKEYTTIVVADTGTGFTIPIELRGEPFVTYKPDGIGMGIGLHLTTLLMESLGGKIIYPDFGDFFIPEIYKQGAIVALAFKEGEKK
jgi:signal transduction histidine kinase